MIKRSMLTIVLFAALHAQADYLFVNVTGNLRKGYPVQVKDSNGKLLATIENGKSAYVTEAREKGYQLQAHKDGGKKKAHPLNFTPRKEDGDVIVIKVRNLMNKLSTEQMSLEKAKSEYSHRVQFPK